ncbi:MAG: MarC family protein [Acidilobaceae archaeon]|nr:MarC family protein [Acidilobaceae archaeon]MCX8165920.1 MarC family protein [Acidilobaceae archaeon]MDW7974563.1 MarC family protein [Sulfolobales archaeon]
MVELADVLELGKPIIMLFVTLDPVGTIPYYQSLVSGMEAKRRNRVLRLSLFVASLLLVLFILVGELIFMLFNITFSDFRVAAGLVLLITSVALLLDIQLGAIRPGTENIAIVPLATPLLAGPAAISISIYIKYHWGLHVAIFSIALVAALSYVILALSDIIFRLVGRQGLIIFDKFMSLIMAALAVSLIRNGLEEAIRATSP